MRFSLRRSPLDGPGAIPARHLIVGLGNPGAEYQNTRHNIGFRVVDRLAERHRIKLGGPERRSVVGRGSVEDTQVVLAKPLTFMNLSGESIAPLLKLLGLTAGDLIVIYDDMDLPIGKLRLRKSGSAGGHNGIKSLISHLRTEDFPRVRVGVGRPSADSRAISHVLGKFGRGELEPIRDAVERAVDAVEAIITDGMDTAMNRFNPG